MAEKRSKDASLDRTMRKMDYRIRRGELRNVDCRCLAILPGEAPLLIIELGG